MQREKNYFFFLISSFSLFPTETRLWMSYVALASLNGWNVTTIVCLIPFGNVLALWLQPLGCPVFGLAWCIAQAPQPPWFRVNITFHPHKSGVWCRQTPGWCRQTPGLAQTDPRKRHSENSTVYHAWGCHHRRSCYYQKEGSTARLKSARHSAQHQTTAQNSMKQHISEKKIVKQ